MRMVRFLPLKLEKKWKQTMAEDEILPLLGLNLAIEEDDDSSDSNSGNAYGQFFC